jgi:hypothetical protein
MCYFEGRWENVDAVFEQPIMARSGRGSQQPSFVRLPAYDQPSTPNCHLHRSVLHHTKTTAVFDFAGAGTDN